MPPLAFKSKPTKLVDNPCTRNRNIKCQQQGWGLCEGSLELFCARHSPSWSPPSLSQPWDTSGRTCSRKDRTCPGFPTSFSIFFSPPACWGGEGRARLCGQLAESSSQPTTSLRNCSWAGTFGTELASCNCPYLAGKVARDGPKPTTFAGFRLCLFPPTTMNGEMQKFCPIQPKILSLL